MKKALLVFIAIVFVSLSSGANEPPTTGEKLSLPPPTGIQATVVGDQIVLSDGRTFLIEKTTIPPSEIPQVTVKKPMGALVTIAYADGNDRFTAQVPFVYTVPVVTKYNEYFKLIVNEGDIQNIWSVNLQHVSISSITIE